MPRRDYDDDAPWLAEAVARPSTNVSKRSLFWTLLVLLSIATVAAVGLVVLLSKKDSGSTQGYMEPDQAPLIAAESGPYKVTPLDPMGMEVEGEGQTIYAAGQGIDQGSIIDTSAGPETPMPRPGAEAPMPRPGAEAPMPRPGAQPEMPPPGLPQDLLPNTATRTAAAPPTASAAALPTPSKSIAIPPVSPAKAPVMSPKTIPTPGIGSAVPPAKAAQTPVTAAQTPANAAQNPANPAKNSGLAQLGAFSSVEKANAAWASLAARPALGGFTRRITVVESDGKTLFRLRASGGDAAELCRSLKAAGAPCTVIE